MIRSNSHTFEALEQLFSIVLHLDDELRITSASATALELMIWLKDKPRLNDAFESVRPRSIKNRQELLERSDQLVLLTAKDGSFALRGQIVSVQNEGGPALLFCGAPWLFWISSEHPELKLSMRHFAPQDAQLDQMFFMSTEKTMVEDLELLNEQLQTAKRELESAQHAREAFFAQMSHEMRTPLNGVVSALALLEPHRLPEEARELVSLIKSSSNNLMNVINYVLDISKIEAANDALEAVAFQLDELIDSVLEIVGARAREKGLVLNTRVRPGLPEGFLGDSARLRQTLLNLVTNAIKFTDRGEVTVEVTEIENRPGWLRFAIIDTGIGIASDQRERIFEPFFSGELKGKSSREAGTGLGLDIVRRNVELMGGELELLTELGQGSTFTVLLPLEPLREAASQATEMKPSEQADADLRGTMLLVDDNETNLMLGTMLLESLGLNVQAAQSGEQAVEMAARQCFCAVLMDIDMPGIDGFEATRRIRALAGRGKVPILALTAYASSREQANAREAGMNDYLTKPISKVELAQALRKWLPGQAKVGKKIPGSEPAVEIDESVLEGLFREIGRDNLDRVLETFGGEARKRWRALTEAASPPDLARAAHALVSSCRSFGLETMAEALTGIEARAREGRMECAATLSRLDHVMAASLEALAAWKPGASGNLTVQ